MSSSKGKEKADDNIDIEDDIRFMISLTEIHGDIDEEMIKKHAITIISEVSAADIESKENFQSIKLFAKILANVLPVGSNIGMSVKRRLNISATIDICKVTDMKIFKEKMNKFGPGYFTKSIEIHFNPIASDGKTSHIPKEAPKPIPVTNTEVLKTKGKETDAGVEVSAVPKLKFIVKKIDSETVKSTDGWQLHCPDNGGDVWLYINSGKESIKFPIQNHLSDWYMLPNMSGFRITVNQELKFKFSTNVRTLGRKNF
jgi:hypothetical protein